MPNPDPRFALQIVTDDIFFHHEGYDLASIDGTLGPLTVLPIIVVDKAGEFKCLQRVLESRYGVSQGRYRLWVIAQRQNRTQRPTSCITSRMSKSSTSQLIPLND